MSTVSDRIDAIKSSNKKVLNAWEYNFIESIHRISLLKGFKSLSDKQESQSDDTLPF